MRKLICFIAALAALAVPATASAQDSVVGAGTEPAWTGFMLTLDVNATSNADGSGVAGTATANLGNGPDTAPVQCLNVTGNTALVGVVYPMYGAMWHKIVDNPVGQQDQFDTVSTGPTMTCGSPPPITTVGDTLTGEFVVIDDPGIVVPPDSDGDGVNDDVDRCPNVAGNRPNGCPALARPESKRDCRNGHWRVYKRQNGSRRFRSEDHCLRYVKRH